MESRARWSHNGGLTCSHNSTQVLENLDEITPHDAVGLMQVLVSAVLGTKKAKRATSSAVTDMLTATALHQLSGIGRLYLAIHGGSSAAQGSGRVMMCSGVPPCSVSAYECTTSRHLIQVKACPVDNAAHGREQMKSAPQQAPQCGAWLHGNCESNKARSYTFFFKFKSVY